MLFPALLLAVAGCSRHGPAVPASVAQDGKRISLDELRCLRSAGEHGPCEIYDVSMVELLARPEVFDRRTVRVFGFMDLGFESSGLYLHEEDYAHGLRRNGVWLNLPEGERPQFNDQYVLVEGVFDARGGGHLGAWSGTINANRLEPWQSHKGPVPYIKGEPHAQ